MTNIDTTRFAIVESLDKGWSKDKKYIVTTHSGERQLLRVSDITELERKCGEFDMLRRMENLGIPTPRPIGFWTENDCVCQLSSWIEGVAVEDAIKNLDDNMQYDLGLKAGKLLRTIHDNLSIDDITEWSYEYGKKLDAIIESYRRAGIVIRQEKAVMDYLSYNRPLLRGRMQVIRHGDFHIGNLIITPVNDITVIDFDQCNPGDPWEEFGGIVWAVRIAEKFAKGQVDGYFDNQVPDEFFRLLALYIGEYILEHVVRSVGGEAHIEKRKQDAILCNTDFMCAMFDNYKTYIPCWYNNISEVT
jgi:aminoglycoside phosphotransferase (APT) family kinase protein